MSQKLYKLIYEDHEINGRAFTKVKMEVLVEYLSAAVVEPITGTKPTPGFRFNFFFNGKSHTIAYPLRHVDWTKDPVFKPLNEYKSKNPDETRLMIEFGGGDSFRNVFKDDPNYDDKIHLRDCICYYESSKLNFKVQVDKLVEM